MFSRVLIAFLSMLIFISVAEAQEDADNGRRLYESRCIACHSLDAHRVGPAHRGVFGSRAGSAAGYNYSNSLQNSQIVWTAENLDRWLSNPERLIPGQKMGFLISNASDRADIIAYLRTVDK